MKASDVVYQRLQTAKEEYLRVLELHESGKASLMYLEHRQGYFDGVEKAWHDVVFFEREQEKSQTPKIVVSFLNKKVVELQHTIHKLVAAARPFLDDTAVDGTSTMACLQDDLETAIENAELDLGYKVQ